MGEPRAANKTTIYDWRDQARREKVRAGRSQFFRASLTITRNFQKISRVIWEVRMRMWYDDVENTLTVIPWKIETIKLYIFSMATKSAILQTTAPISPLSQFFHTKETLHPVAILVQISSIYFWYPNVTVCRRGVAELCAKDSTRSVGRAPAILMARRKVSEDKHNLRISRKIAEGYFDCGEASLHLGAKCLKTGKWKSFNEKLPRYQRI